MVIIYFFGPDGAGKSTLVKGLVNNIQKNHKVKLSWMRGSHTITSFLAKILSRFNFFKGPENPYYNINIPKNLKGLWQLLEFISALPVIIIRFLLPSFMGCWVIADRYTLDLTVWISLTTRDNSFLEKPQAKVLIALAKNADAKFYVKADVKTLSERRGERLPNPEEQISLYDKLAQAIGATTIDTTDKSTHDSLQEVSEVLKTGELLIH